MTQPRSDKSAVQSAIARHLSSTESGRDWAALRAQYPDIPPATFWRWVREVRNHPRPEQLQAARQLLAITPGGAVPENAVLPAPIALTAIASDRLRGQQQIHFFLELQQLMADARLLREFALSPCQTKVKNPRVLADSAKLRSQFLQLYLTALPQLYASEQTQKLYVSIIEAVAACEPGVARSITQKLKSLSEEAGFLSAPVP